MAEDNIVPFTGNTVLDTPPEQVLEGASKFKFERVMVIGLLEDGTEFVSSSAADGGAVLWDIERAKLRLLRMPDER